MLGVDDGDTGEVYNVLDFIAPLEDVNGLVHASEHRPNRVCIAQSLEEFVANVSGFEIREDEDIRGIIQLGKLVGPREDFFADSGVGLYFAVNGEVNGGILARSAGSLVGLAGTFVVDAPELEYELTDL